MEQSDDIVAAHWFTAESFSKCPECDSSNLVKNGHEVFCGDCGLLIAEDIFDLEPEYNVAANFEAKSGIEINSSLSLGMDGRQNYKLIQRPGYPHIQSVEKSGTSQAVEEFMTHLGYGEIKRPVERTCIEIFNNAERNLNLTLPSRQKDNIIRWVDTKVTKLKAKKRIKDVKAASMFCLSDNFDSTYTTAQWNSVIESITEQAELYHEEALKNRAKINQEIGLVQSYLNASINDVWSSSKEDIKRAGEKVDIVLHKCLILPVVLWDKFLFQAYDSKKWRRIFPLGYKNKVEKILDEAFSELVRQCNNTSAPGWEVRKKENCNWLTLAGLIETIREMQSRRNIKLINSVEQVAATFGISPSTINRGIKLFRKLIR